jgi:hypothetical protein
MNQQEGKQVLSNKYYSIAEKCLLCEPSYYFVICVLCFIISSFMGGHILLHAILGKECLTFGKNIYVIHSLMKELMVECVAIVLPLFVVVRVCGNHG